MKQKKPKLPKCECCKKDIVKIGNTRFCNDCSIHNLKYQKKISKLKYEIKKLRIKFYGVLNGQERMHYKKHKKEVKNGKFKNNNQRT